SNTPWTLSWDDKHPLGRKVCGGAVGIVSSKQSAVATSEESNNNSGQQQPEREPSPTSTIYRRNNSASTATTTTKQRDPRVSIPLIFGEVRVQRTDPS
ncbi:hypothetical protein H5410_057108, partial [Solanum commersonii]